MNILHNRVAQRFEITIDGTTAYLGYQSVDDNTLNYNHTIVPTALAGRGIGSALTKFALEHAQDHNKNVIASCSFVARYVEKNPHCRQILAE